MKRTVCILVLLAGFLPSWAQNLEQREKALAAQIIELHRLRFDADSDSLLRLSEKVEDGVLTILRHPDAGSYPFSILDSLMGIRTSPDGRVKTLAWDGCLGGTWHDLRAVLRYQGPSGEITVFPLHCNCESGEGLFSDSAPIEIYQVGSGESYCYLIFANGTHGSGMHHTQARLFQVTGNGLEEVQDGFNGEREIVCEVPRSMTRVMDFDATSVSIAYITFSTRDAYETGQEPETIRLTWNGRKFIQQD